MTTEEKRMMQPTQEYIRRLQHKRNAGTENCMLSSDLAREMGITALDLHHYLIDVGFLYRERNTYELKLCKRYAGLGYAKTRSHFRYNSKGDLVETRYPVWTEKGLEFIRKLIKGQGTTNDTNLTNCFYGKNC
jgi:phage antirepressor YoqD-like protein